MSKMARNLDKQQIKPEVERTYINVIGALIFTIMVIALLAALFGIAFFVNSGKEYNHYACHATGYQDDCVTPLSK